MTELISTSPRFACLTCGRISSTRRCEQHGGTDKRPGFSQRGYAKQFQESRTKLLADHPTCCVTGCTQVATVAHHSPLRRTLVAMGVKNVDGIEWLRAMCIQHHNATAAQGR